MGYDLKSIRQDFKQKGIFYTQKELAIYLKSFFPDDVAEIYDPTCGDGGLLSVFDDNVQKYGQDINLEQVQAAKERLKNFHGVAADTLRNPAFTDRKFKYIIANPPFSIKWEPIKDERFSPLPALPPKGKADYAFIAHILHCLDNDGMAVVLNFPGILYRGDAEGKIRQWMVERNYIDTVVAIDGGHFVDTKIATCALVLRKNKGDKKVRFVHNEYEYIAEYDEIEKNNFCLSVSLYIDETEKREPEDPMKLEMQARKSFLKRLRGELQFESAVCKLEGISIIPFLKEIMEIVNSFL